MNAPISALEELAIWDPARALSQLRKSPQGSLDPGAFYRCFAMCCGYLGRFEEANRYLGRAARCWAGNPVLEAEVLIVSAGLQHALGDGEGALRRFARARQIFFAKGESTRWAQVGASEAGTLRSIGKFREALGLLGEVEGVLPKTGDRWHWAHAQNTALAKSDSGDTDGAIRFLGESVRIVAAVGSPRQLGRWHWGASAVMHGVGQIHDAQRHGQEALRMMLEARDGFGAAFVFLDLVEIQIQTGDVSAARSTAAQAFRLLAVLGSERDLQPAHRELLQKLVSRAVAGSSRLSEVQAARRVLRAAS